MSLLYRSAASLGFYGDDLAPAEITAALGREPTVGARKDAIWRTAAGAEKIARTGQWRLQAERCEPGHLDGQINGLLSGLSGDLPAWRALAERYRGRIFCGLFLAESNERLTLEPATLALVAERGLMLDLDIYAGD